MTVIQTDPPVLEPISIVDLKSYLRIETNDENDLLGALILAARSHVETITGVTLVEQGFRQYLDDWPSGPICLQRYPARRIEQVTVYDKDGQPQSVSVTALELDGASRPPRLALSERLKPGKVINGIEIDFIAGFGTTSVDVPADLRRAILELSAHWYEFRGAVAPHQQPVSVPSSINAILAPYTSVRL